VKRLLITGFEPFKKLKINPSEEVVKLLKDEELDSSVITTAVLPVDMKSVWRVMEEVILGFRPDIILGLGLALRRSKISLEKVAINLLDFEFEDNSGNFVEDVRILEGSPDAYFSNMPLRLLEKKLKEREIPVRISYSAGAFLCNQVFYLIMNHIKGNKNKILGGFVHLPPVPEIDLSDEYSHNTLPLAVEFKAVKLICSTLVKFYGND